MAENRNFTVRVWRQADANAAGKFVDYAAKDVSTDASFLEMLDLLNDDLIRKGEVPIAFDSDCREGICGSCSCIIDGVPHSPEPAVATCQVYMRNFANGATITVEPWRARAFPVIKDLVVDRSAFDRIIAAGGYISVNTGSAPEANDTPDSQARRRCRIRSGGVHRLRRVRRRVQERARPRCSPARRSSTSRACRKAARSGLRRVRRMVEQMEAEGFGGCSNEGECEAVCPKEIPTAVIQRMNRDYVAALVKGL
jgi:succinate dehydrogenase / fumarate reductase iron-sulfur subunit